MSSVYLKNFNFKQIVAVNIRNSITHNFDTNIICTGINTVTENSFKIGILRSNTSKLNNKTVLIYCSHGQKQYSLYRLVLKSINLI